MPVKSLKVAEICGFGVWLAMDSSERLYKRESIFCGMFIFPSRTFRTALHTDANLSNYLLKKCTGNVTFTKFEQF